MNRGLRPHAEYAAAYLDDVIIHSDTRSKHLRWVAAVLESLRKAGLTANPNKCVIGRREVRYLGYHLGGGRVRPQLDKADAVAACLQPKTKKQVLRDHRLFQTVYPCLRGTDQPFDGPHRSAVLT